MSGVPCLDCVTLGRTVSPRLTTASGEESISWRQAPSSESRKSFPAHLRDQGESIPATICPGTRRLPTECSSLRKRNHPPCGLPHHLGVEGKHLPRLVASGQGKDAQSPLAACCIPGGCLPVPNPAKACAPGEFKNFEPARALEIVERPYLAPRAAALSIPTDRAHLDPQLVRRPWTFRD